MTLLVKDANTTVQSLSTVVDGNGNLVPAHAPATTSAQGVATPVGPQNPLPVVNTAGSAAGDGSGTVPPAVQRRLCSAARCRPTVFWCRTIPRRRCGSATPAPRRTAAPRSSSPPMAGSSQRPRATSRPARSASTAARPANPSPPAAGEHKNTRQAQPASFETRSGFRRSAPQDEERLSMASTSFLILRSPRSGRLEGRRMAIPNPPCPDLFRAPTP